MGRGRTDSRAASARGDGVKDAALTVRASRIW
jgi:hypothetical protein